MQTSIFENPSLEDAKRHIRANFEKGTECPCCGQYVKLYNYKMFATSAFALIRLYKLGPGWHHIRNFAEQIDGKQRAAHFADMRHWDLIEAKANIEPEKKSGGFWRITTYGEEFVRGVATIPERIRIYNNKFQGFDGPPIDIHIALGNKFNYREIMGYE